MRSLFMMKLFLVLSNDKLKKRFSISSRKIQDDYQNYNTKITTQIVTLNFRRALNVSMFRTADAR